MEQIAAQVDNNLRHHDSIGKYVSVKTVDSEEHQGWLRCIDPLSGNMILLTTDDDCSKVVAYDLLMGHACSTIEVIREPDDKIIALIEKLKREAEEKELAARKQLVLAWIKKNRLPVVENDDQSLVVAECVTIFPPYQIDNCDGQHNITLKNIRRMLAKMPLTIKQIE